MSTSEIMPQEYKVFFQEIERKTEGQKKAILEKLQRIIKIPEEYQLIKGMMELYAQLEIKKAQSTTYIKAVIQTEEESEKAQQDINKIVQEMGKNITRAEKKKLETILEITDN